MEPLHFYVDFVTIHKTKGVLYKFLIFILAQALLDKFYSVPSNEAKSLSKTFAQLFQILIQITHIFHIFDRTSYLTTICIKRFGTNVQEMLTKFANFLGLVENIKIQIFNEFYQILLNKNHQRSSVSSKYLRSISTNLSCFEISNFTCQLCFE